VHVALSVAEPLHQQPRLPAGKFAAVVFAVLVEPGQRLAGSCLPERQLWPWPAGGTSMTTAPSLLWCVATLNLRDRRLDGPRYPAGAGSPLRN
jgi:hypothetical protein